MLSVSDSEVFRYDLLHHQHGSDTWQELPIKLLQYSLVQAFEFIV